MILQTIKWPKNEVCNVEEMYYHKVGDVFYTDENVLHIAKGSKCFLDSYFNSLSIDKWKKYTIVDNVYAVIKVKGYGKISAQYKMRVTQWDLPEYIVDTVEVNCDEPTEVKLSFPSNCTGMIFLGIEAFCEDFIVYGGSYNCDVDENKVRDIKIGIGICTFRRESFVERNISLLNGNIFNNKKSSINGHLEVFISDNGKTLDAEKLSSKNIHMFQNKNTGGAGGFTRTLIEMMKVRKDTSLTHALLMDDDITIDTEALERTYVMLSLLKEEYKDSFIGGAMLRNDRTFMQVESGAAWNAGALKSYKQNLDLRSAEACLYNELEERYEFNAWWYCCFPLNVVTDKNLPMPIFIRGDDLEYGLRNMKNLILLNGICVWHEPFENKYSSFLNYYIFRNKLIDNAIHFPEYGKKQLIKELRMEVLREVFLYRYKNVDLLLQGVEDFLEGVDFLLNTDGEKLHKDIMAAGYKAETMEALGRKFYISEYENYFLKDDSKADKIKRVFTFNGYILSEKGGMRTLSMSHVNTSNTYRASEILYVDIVTKKGFVVKRDKREMKRCMRRYRRVVSMINRKYDKAKKDYQNRIEMLRSIEFWNKYLGL